MMEKGEIDWVIFAGGCGILLSVVTSIVLFPELSGQVIGDAFTFITQNLGVVYVVITIAVFIFLLWLALSRYGAIKLGEDEPVYGTFSWAAMMFCAGIGASLIYLGAIEWVYYYQAPPFGIEPGSDSAIAWAASYGIFHWGPVG